MADASENGRKAALTDSKRKRITNPSRRQHKRIFQRLNCSTCWSKSLHSNSFFWSEDWLFKASHRDRCWTNRIPDVNVSSTFLRRTANWLKCRRKPPQKSSHFFFRELPLICEMQLSCCLKGLFPSWFLFYLSWLYLAFTHITLMYKCAILANHLRLSYKGFHQSNLTSLTERQEQEHIDGVFWGPTS